MKLSEVKKILPLLDNVVFALENGSFVPEHFHVTEVGQITKHFIDCGGVIRTENVVNFQLWNANDLDHHLKPSKLLHIITLSEEKLHLLDAEVEVEYQMETIGKFGLEFDGKNFILKNKNTACLASDSCGILAELLNDTATTNACCSPNSNCC